MKCGKQKELFFFICNTLSLSLCLLLSPFFSFCFVLHSGPSSSAAATAKGKNQVQHRPALHVVVPRLLLVGHLFPGKDQPLLRGGDPLLLLDALLDARDGVGGLDVDLDLLAREGLDLDHHAAAEGEGRRRGKGKEDRSGRGGRGGSGLFFLFLKRRRRRGPEQSPGRRGEAERAAGDACEELFVVVVVVMRSRLLRETKKKKK